MRLICALSIATMLAGCAGVNDCTKTRATVGAVVGGLTGVGAAVLIAAVTGPEHDPRGDEELGSAPVGLAAGAALGGYLGARTGHNLNGDEPEKQTL
jgi:hypothetical protein